MYTDFFSTLDFAFGVTAPIFVIVFLGVMLKYWDVIDEAFMNKASKLIFVVALPCLLFMSIVKTDIQKLFNLSLLISSGLATLLIYVLLGWSAKLLVKNKRDHGVFVQGALRGNLAIIGLAFCMNAYGEPGFAIASILMSILTLMYNILSVMTLSSSLASDEKPSAKKITLDLIKNPLIIAIISGVCFSLLRIPIPEIVMQSGSYLAKMTLPLALLCIGGSLSLDEFKSSSGTAILSVLAKLIVTPAIIVYIAYLVGFRGMELGVLFLMVSAPTAAVSYVKVQAIGGNVKLAANIIALSTLASLFTVSLGLVFLRYFAWI